jgi:toxin-antitoxin system PIN domain toxin
MSAALLDVNVLLALAWPSHAHHDAADEWFLHNRRKGWATCLLTQLAFLRLSTQPAVVKTAITIQDAHAVLAANLEDEHHEFWPLDYPVTQVLPEIRQRLAGHRLLTDALLLDLAIRRQGRLATLDQRIGSLLEPSSPHLSRLEILPIV